MIMDTTVNTVITKVSNQVAANTAPLYTENLCFSYYERPILRDISLSLRRGEFLGLLGPNGSGKSTFLKNLLGYLKPSQGRIVFAGEPGKPCIAFVPQSTGLAAAMTVRDVVLMGRLPYLKDRWAGYRREDHERVTEILSTLGLLPLADRNMLNLSGGELQKTLIARCLVQEGDILLLDEATSGLDLNHTIEIMELMKKKTSEDAKTVVAVLHDLNLASQYCDRIVMLKNGAVYCAGTPGTVLTEEVLDAVYGIRAVIQRDEYGNPFVVPRRSSSMAGTRAQMPEQKAVHHV
jgi:iron complex transport system ATP-binding protein